jgi:hypothetical protein
MAFTHETIDGGRGVEFAGTGDLTGREILELKRRLLADEAGIRKWRFGFVLLTNLKSFQISVEDVRAIAEIDKRMAALTPEVVLAVIAPRDHDFGMARMWESILDIPGWRTAVFRARAEAELWMADTLPSSSDATEPHL